MVASRIFLSGVCAVVFTGSSLSYAFYGRHSAEATLKYRAVIEMTLPQLQSLKQIQTGGELRDDALEQIDEQVQHLMGTFQSTSFIEEVGGSGALGATYSIKFIKVENIKSSENKLITYEFTGKTIFEKELFKNKKSIGVPIKLPLDSTKIYCLGFKTSEEVKTCLAIPSRDDLPDDYLNFCTDDHYNTEGDFWYFWDPEQEDCPLNNNKADVVRVTGTLTRTDAFEYTYPEYNKLFQTNYNNGSLDISVFLGYIDEETLDAVNVNKGDEGYYAMTVLEDELKHRAFKLSTFKNEFSDSNPDHKGIAFERVYEKMVTPESGSGLAPTLVRIKILLADTAITSEDETFRRALVQAMRESEVVVYDGHSGLGGNLDVERIEGLTLDPSKYQIYFFNGCSSYRYYNYMYFKSKGGSKNLDIISTGLQSSSDVTATNIIAFLNYFISGQPRTYQKVIQNLEASNGEDNGTFLISISGDENNVWKPKVK